MFAIWILDFSFFLSLFSRPEVCEAATTAIPMKRTSRLLVAAVAVLGVLLATAGFTSEPGAEAATAAFILDILPQLMGGPPKNSFPRLSRCPHCMRAEASVGSSAQLRPLPADIDAHDPDWQQRLQAVMHSEPAVVRGLQYVESRRFGNMSGLNVPRLRELYRGRSVTTFTHMTHDTSAVDMSFDDFADRMNDEEEMLYARAMPDVTGAFNNFDLDWVAGTLWGRLWSWRFTQFTGGKPLQGRIGLGFVGSKHVWTQAHCDVGSSSFLMLHGRKRWVFFSPTQTRWMYPYGQYRNVAYNAGLDVFAPNLTEVPLFANVRGYEVVLQPGVRRIHPPAASASPRQWPAPPLPAASAATAHNVRGARRVRRRHLLPGPCRGCRAAH